MKIESAHHKINHKSYMIWITLENYVIYIFKDVHSKHFKINCITHFNTGIVV